MIIKGGAGGNAKWWGDHLTNDQKNTRVEIKEMRGVLSQDLHKALYEMRGVAEGSRCGPNFLYQANINPEHDEHLTEDQWREAFDTLEKNLGLEGHSRVIVEHEKNGRVHRHCIWNRVDAETMQATNMWGNYKVHVATARELESRFDLSPTPNPAREREPAPELWEHRAAERSGIDRAAVTEEITAAWRRADNGHAFKAAIEERGYILAKGDRRDFCIIDHAGDVHSLAKRLDGVRVAEVRAFMSDVDREALPSVAEASAMQRDRPVDERFQHAARQATGAYDHTATEAHNLRDEIGPSPASGAEPSGRHDQGATEAHNLRDEVFTRWTAEQPRQQANDAPRFEEAAAQPEPANDDARAGGGIKDGFAVVDAAANAIASLSDFVADLLSFGATETRPDPAEQIIQRRRAAAALHNIRDDIEQGKPLNAEDVRNLTPETLENIRAKGDDFLRLLVEQQQRDEQERRRGGMER